MFAPELESARIIAKPYDETEIWTLSMTEKPDEFLRRYFVEATRLLDPEPYLSALIATADLLRSTAATGNRVWIVGNGGSAAIASHIAIDLTKNAGIPSQTFNDAAEITCLANDFGYDNWIAQGIRLKAREADCLIAISSSGSSPNIANAARQARASKLSVVALSGMASDNPLRKLGNIDLWIDSRSYNLIEATHQFWLMSVVDLLIGGAVYRADREVQPKIHRNERPA